MDILNYIIDKCIKKYEINNIEELHFQERCCSIILSHPVTFSVPKYKKKYSFDESFKISYDFLNSISKDYADLLIKRRNENAFIVDDSKNPSYSSSFSNIIDGVPKMYILFVNNIGCSYSITHEFIHDTTILGSENSMTRTIFCEVPSLYAEKLQDKYLESIHHVDAYVHARDNAKIVQNKALYMSFELKLIRIFLEKGYIKNSDIEMILKSFNYDYRVFYHYVHMMYEEYLFWGYDQRHVLGCIIASYLLERKNNIKEFLEINELLNKIDINNFLNYLDLERTGNINVFDLTEASYKKLQDSYQKQLKKIR